MLRNNDRNWGSVSRFFHWGMALAIFSMFVLGWIMINVPLSPLKLELFIWHKSIGITLLGVVVLRIVWRLVNPTPRLPSNISKGEQHLARYGQLWLYILMILMPLSGWIINSAANFPLRWFSLFTIPAIADPSHLLEDQAKMAHFILFILLALTIAGHIIAALYHHRVSRNNVLNNMLGKDS